MLSRFCIDGSDCVLISEDLAQGYVLFLIDGKTNLAMALMYIALFHDIKYTATVLIGDSSEHEENKLLEK